ncbi:MAG: DUF1289 domain-containing protein [Candidatus Puniceispirillaceae bacterium]
MTERLPSPCISICQINPTSGECSGCHRTRAEIASWPRMTLDEQAQLLAQLRKRREASTGISRRQSWRQRKKFL